MASSDVPGIVSCEWLKDALDSNTSGIKVLDATWYSDKDAKKAYNEKHIPHAQFFDIFKGATNTATHIRNIPPPEAFQEQARAVGINDDDHIIVYDSIPGKFGLFLGSRTWWMFRLHGHTKVSVLNGGLDKWLSLGYRTTTEVSEVKPGNFTVKFNSSLLRQFDEMTDIAQTGGQVMDTRPEEAFKGKEGDPKTGHVKGAVSTPFPLSFVDQSSGTIKAQDQLKAAFDETGIKVDRPITGVCNGGMSSSTVALTAYLLGNKDAAVYLGGFNEWKQRAPDDLIKRS